MSSHFAEPHVSTPSQVCKQCIKYPKMPYFPRWCRRATAVDVPQGEVYWTVSEGCWAIPKLFRLRGGRCYRGIPERERLFWCQRGWGSYHSMRLYPGGERLPRRQAHSTMHAVRGLTHFNGFRCVLVPSDQVRSFMFVRNRAIVTNG